MKVRRMLAQLRCILGPKLQQNLQRLVAFVPQFHPGMMYVIVHRIPQLLEGGVGSLVQSCISRGEIGYSVGCISGRLRDGRKTVPEPPLLNSRDSIEFNVTLARADN